MKKMTFLKWIRLDKEYILSCVLGSFAGAICAVLLFLITVNLNGFSFLFNEMISPVKACCIVFMVCLFFVFISLVIYRYLTIAEIANFTLNDIEKMSEEEVRENLNLLIDLMVKNDEDKDHKLKEIEHFTKDEATAELYAWIRKIHYA